MFLLHEGGDKIVETNCNTVLKDMGIQINDDSVMRQVYYKYLHPKEVFVEEGVLMPDLAKKKVRVPPVCPTHLVVVSRCDIELYLILTFPLFSPPRLLWHGMVWYGMVWYGMVR